MSKKNYILLAKILRKQYQYWLYSTRKDSWMILKVLDTIIQELCIELKEDNINFSKDKFIDYITITKDDTKKIA